MIGRRRVPATTVVAHVRTGPRVGSWCDTVGRARRPAPDRRQPTAIGHGLHQTLGASCRRSMAGPHCPVSRRRGGAARGGGPCRARCAGSPRRARARRGAQNAGSVSLTAARRSSSVGGPPVDGHDDGRDDVAPLVVGRAGDRRRRATPRRSRSTASTGSGQTFSPPVMIRSPARPSTCSRPSSSQRPRSPVASHPSASSGVGCRRGRPAAASGRAGGSRRRRRCATSTPSSGRPS